MIKNKAILAVSLLAALSVSASAYAFSSLVSLGGGVAAPLSNYEVSLGKLREGVTYDVHCTLESNNQSNQELNYIQVLSSSNFGMGANFSVNGNTLNASGVAQAAISTTKANEFVTYSVNNTFNMITVRNLDDTDTVIIKNCYALPAV